MSAMSYVDELNTPTPELSPSWPAAEVVAEPIDERKLGSKIHHIVRRHRPMLSGLDGQEIVFLPGPSHISLFTGCGGFDLGCEAAGFCTVLQHEWDRTCCQTLVANRPTYFRHAALVQSNILETPTSVLLDAAGLRVGEAHLVTGGPPCQGFSVAGRRNPADKRNLLIFEWVRVVREMQPKFAAFENVPGFTSMLKGNFLRAFLHRCWEAYYVPVYAFLNASNYGVPQHRVRFIAMLTRRDLVECEGVLGSLPKPTHFRHAGEYNRARADIAAGSMFRDELEAETRPLERPPGIRYYPDREVLIPPTPSQGRHDGPEFTKRYRAFYDRLEREEPDRLVFEPTDAAPLP